MTIRAIAATMVRDGPPRPWLVTGAVSERPKETVLKTVVRTPHRGFESLPLRN